MQKKLFHDESIRFDQSQKETMYLASWYLANIYRQMELTKLVELTSESVLLEFNLPEAFPLFPGRPEAVEALTPELVLLEALDFAPRPAVPDLTEPRAQVASWEDFLTLTWPVFVDLLFPYCCWGSRLGGLQTSGSSVGATEEVGYSSSGWNTKPPDLEEIGGEAGRLLPGISLKDLLSASNFFTISISSERPFLQFIHFVRINGSSSVLKCLEIVKVREHYPSNEFWMHLTPCCFEEQKNLFEIWVQLILKIYRHFSQKYASKILYIGFKRIPRLPQTPISQMQKVENWENTVTDVNHMSDKRASIFPYFNQWYPGTSNK